MWSWSFRKVCPACVLLSGNTDNSCYPTLLGHWTQTASHLKSTNLQSVSTGIMAGPLWKGINRKSKYAVDLIMENRYLHHCGLLSLSQSPPCDSLKLLVTTEYRLVYHHQKNFPSFCPHYIPPARSRTDCWLESGLLFLKLCWHNACPPDFSFHCSLPQHKSDGNVSHFYSEERKGTLLRHHLTQGL